MLFKYRSRCEEPSKTSSPSLVIDRKHIREKCRQCKGLHDVPSFAFHNWCERPDDRRDIHNDVDEVEVVMKENGID